MTAYNRQQFFADLAKASPLNALAAPTSSSAPTDRRGRRSRNSKPLKPAYLTGPQIYVVYKGQTTPNLRVASSPAGKELYQDVRKIIGVLRLPIPNYP